MLTVLAAKKPTKNLSLKSVIFLDLSLVLIFVEGLEPTCDAGIRSEIVMKLEEDTKVTLQTIPEECLRIIKLRHDTETGEKKDMAKVCVIDEKTSKKKSEQKESEQKPCHGFDEVHDKKRLSVQS